MFAEKKKNPDIFFVVVHERKLATFVHIRFAL